MLNSVSGFYSEWFMLFDVKMYFGVFWWIESLKNQNLFEIKININVFFVTFDQFYASLLNKSIWKLNNSFALMYGLLW